MRISLKRILRNRGQTLDDGIYLCSVKRGYASFLPMSRREAGDAIIRIGEAWDRD